MKSLRFSEFGAPSVLRIEEVATPVPSGWEALVRVKAAAINSSDIGYVARRFKKTTLPRTPGRDSAGIVIKGNTPKALKFGAVLRSSVSSMTVLMRNMSLSQWRRYRPSRSR
jgi:NADPH:quinone reductase-like Zn-dependent oxidoreductase